MKRHIPLFYLLLCLLVAACGGGGGSNGPAIQTPPPAPLINIPKTGQIVSYDTNTVRLDDGALQKGTTWPQPRFDDKGDGTVIDGLTGLMWLKDANCMKTYYPSYDTNGTAGDGAVYWQQALNFMSSMPTSSCGGMYSDWRLPNFREMSSLLDYSGSFTMIPVGSPFTNVQGSSTSYYWTSTTDGATGAKLSINVGNGLSGMSIANTDNFVWPVRTGQTTTYAALPRTGQLTSSYSGDDGNYHVGVAWPSPRFSARTDASVRDNLTGLNWAPNGNLMVSRNSGSDTDGTVDDGKVTWQHALDYVALLNAQNYLGHNDWRLPNVLEIDSLVHYGYAQETCSGTPCASSDAWLNTQGFVNIQPLGAYWSSTSRASNPSTYACILYSYDFKSNYHYIWPVRGPQ